MSESPQTEPRAPDPVRALRHDLRNLIAPAMLHAELLGAHADPAVKARSARILEALDLVTARLKKG